MSGVEQALSAYMHHDLASMQRPSLHVATQLFDRPLSDFEKLDPATADTLASAIAQHLSQIGTDWTPSANLMALRVLKDLSRSSLSSRSLANSVAIRRLTQIASTHCNSIEQNDAYEQLDLVLRTLNNVLFIHESARPIFASDHEAVKLSLDLIAMDRKDSTLTFLGARLLFFATIKPSVVLINAVQGLQLVDVFTKRLDELLQAAEDETQTITELLKAFFNVSLYYPQLARGQRTDDAIVGEKFDETVLPFLEPVLRLTTTWVYDKKAVFVSPWSNAIAVLLNFPVRSYERLWLTSAAPSSLRRSQSNGRRKSASSRGSAGSSAGANDVDGVGVMATARRKASSILRTSLSMPFRASVSMREMAGESAIVSVLLNMIEACCIRYLGSQDIDDTAAIKLAQMDDVDLEAIVEPPLLLLRKLADESDQFRTEIKQRLLPSNIDRSVGLDRRSDLTGIMVRLMGSHNFQRLARASGEALLATCGGKPTEMTAEIGYGPCAGFLMRIGQAHAMPGPMGSVATGEGDDRRLIDPVTGMTLPSEEELARIDAENGLASMSEEEKAAEAERLFTLFDRLDKTGVVSIDPNSHPMRRAAETGRLQEIDREQDSEDARRAEEEDKTLAEEVEREMKAYRSKK